MEVLDSLCLSKKMLAVLFQQVTNLIIKLQIVTFPLKNCLEQFIFCNGGGGAGETKSCYVSQAGLKFTNFLSQPLEC